MSDNELIAEAEGFLQKAPYLNYGTARKLVGALKDRQWISVNDSLPLEHSCRSENRGDVMTWTMSDPVLVAHAGAVKMGYTESGVWYDDCGEPAIVDYWMPLPEAPKEEKV